MPYHRRPYVVAAATLLCLPLLGVGPAAGQPQQRSIRSVGTIATDEVPANVMQAARTAVSGPDLAGKDGPMASLGLELALLYHQHRWGGSEAVQALQAHPSQPDATALDRTGPAGRLYSPVGGEGRTVTVTAVAASDASRLYADLRDLGLDGGAVAENLVSGRLPISALRNAARLASLRGMLPARMRVSAGSVGSEADTAHAADEARLNKGVSGSGQKVCALSDSYDTADAATTAADDVQSGDLPGSDNPEGRTTPVDVLADYDGSDPAPTDEGRAMLQLVHDIAPGASLGFHTAFGGLAAFADGIRTLAGSGCTVVVDDVSYSIEPFYQDGPVANAVDEVVAGEGVTYFASAGNNGQSSYEAPFRNSGRSGAISSSSVRHDFDPSPATDTRQEITVASGGTFRVFSFQWTDPSAVVESSAGPDTDLDIALVDANGNVVAESSNDSIANGVPAETLEYTNDTESRQTLHLVIEKAAGPDPEEIKYVYFGQDFDIQEYDTLGPTIFGHSMAEGALAVGAAPFFNTAEYNSNVDSAAVLNFFSAKGGIQIRFDQEGGRLSPPEVREKPDVTGTDYVDNTFFGSDIDASDPDPYPNFAGTSAAAPNVAAIAALVQEARPGLTPTQVYGRLEDTAADVQFRQKLESGELKTERIGEGVDPWSGHGFVQADRAVPAPSGVQIANLRPNASFEASARSGEVTLMWRQVGSEGVDEIVVEQSYFTSGFTERVRFRTDGSGQYTRTLSGLVPGRHQFRVSAVARVDTDGDGTAETDSLLAVNQTTVTLRTPDVTVTAYPNPFTEQVRLSVTVPNRLRGREIAVQVRVYDALGRRVAVPIFERQITGSRTIGIESEALRSLGSGVYFFRVIGRGQEAEFTKTTKAVRVR